LQKLVKGHRTQAIGILCDGRRKELAAQVRKRGNGRLELLLEGLPLGAQGMDACAVLSVLCD
jgi:hypothetical protein